MTPAFIAGVTEAGVMTFAALKPCLSGSHIFVTVTVIFLKPMMIFSLRWVTFTREDLSFGPTEMISYAKKKFFV